MSKTPKQTEEVWKCDIQVNDRLGTVLDSFAASHGADSAKLETITCQKCGVSNSTDGDPEDKWTIYCPNCHSYGVVITEVRLFTTEVSHER
jgi:Zn finger protein HypA/HybF involved in hydrogenase expression